MCPISARNWRRYRSTLKGERTSLIQSGPLSQIGHRRAGPVRKIGHSGPWKRMNPVCIPLARTRDQRDTLTSRFPDCRGRPLHG
jgi:hypothetical protein